MLCGSLLSRVKFTRHLLQGNEHAQPRPTQRDKGAAGSASGQNVCLEGMQRYGSLKRRSLMSPKAWKTSFSDFHKSYNPKPAQRFSFKSPDKPRHSTLSRESSILAVSPPSPLLETPEPRDPDAGSSPSETHGSPAQGDAAAENQLKSGEDSSQVEEEKGLEEEEPTPPAGSDDKGDGGKAPASESSSELNNSCDSLSLELQLSAADDIPLHIEEREEDTLLVRNAPKPNGLENGEVSGLTSDTKDLSIPHKRSAEEIEGNSCTREKNVETAALKGPTVVSRNDGLCMDLAGVSFLFIFY
ncbi:hypothetical protein FQN60_002266 [Etheostoma spectabile]|uniref:Uncharacterized protein n=1 Tax=Etheostoma spectabile TaxID=54343 RepID=A0A5J5DCW3_9PERO|nr:hypothetical protein FQN60_002266 [Etheostoma spectabile]